MTGTLFDLDQPRCGRCGRPLVDGICPVCSLNEQKPLARRVDPSTSQRAAGQHRLRRGTQRHQLLVVFASGPGGLTAEEAGVATGIDGAWKRVSDLLNDKLVEDTGEERRSLKGSAQRVLRITQQGRDVLAALPSKGRS
jgi:hypothetical protein